MKQEHYTLVGWAIFLLMLYLLSKSKMGYHIIYYVLMLVLVFLLVRNYKQITAAMVQQG